MLTDDKEERRRLDDVERGVADLAHMEAAAPFDRQAAGLFAIFESGDRRLEIAGIGEAIGADRPTIRHGELGAIVFTDIAARAGLEQLHVEFYATWDDANFPRLDLDAAEFGEKRTAPSCGTINSSPSAL